MRDLSYRRFAAGSGELSEIPVRAVREVLVEEVQTFARGEKDVGVMGKGVEQPRGTRLAGPDVEEVRSRGIADHGRLPSLVTLESSYDVGDSG